MQIGDSHESITRDASARREAMVGQIRQLVERLNVAPGAAIPPAAIEVDTVRISPEARQAMNSLAATGQTAGGASPGQVIGAIRAVLLASNPEASAAATARLAELVRNIVTTFPARTTTTLRGYPVDDHAAYLVRALLSPPPGGAPEPPAIAALVRSLFAGQAEGDAPPEAALQRAALAIFLAATRTAADAAAPSPIPAPGAEAQTQPRDLPAALLGHLAQPGGRKPAPGTRRRRPGDDSPPDPEDDAESGEEGSPRQKPDSDSA